MTRAEAIEWIYTIDTNYDLALREREALRMAIEALQTERRNAIIDALDSVTSYNGLAEEVESWKHLEPNDYGSITAPDNVVIPKTAEDYQLQVIWMILVELWGDCGTSPRSGWLYTANKEHIDTFIDGITETEQAERRMTKGGEDE